MWLNVISWLAASLRRGAASQGCLVMTQFNLHCITLVRLCSDRDSRHPARIGIRIRGILLGSGFALSSRYKGWGGIQRTPSLVSRVVNLRASSVGSAPSRAVLASHRRRESPCADERRDADGMHR